jgi:hypothetical protein
MVCVVLTRTREGAEMRRIVAVERQAAGGAEPIDSYFDRVLKYIPADVVGAWVAVTGLIAGSSDVPKGTLLWIMFLALAAISMAWTLKQTAVTGKPPAYTQAAIATGSFVVWVIALGGPFATLDIYRPVYGSLLLIVYTLTVGLVVPEKS